MRIRRINKGVVCMSGMTLDSFMLGVKESVRNAAIEDTILQLKKPSGRNPRRRHVEQSEWFNQLSSEDQDMVTAILKEAVDEALFGIFAVLDNVRAINDDNTDEEDGSFELYYVKDGSKVLLNKPDGMYLHDEYNAITNKDE